MGRDSVGPSFATSDRFFAIAMAHHSQVSVTTDPTFTAKSRTTWEVVRRVAVYLRPYRWMALGTILCALMSLAFSFVFPKLTQYIIDVVIGQRRPDLLSWTGFALLGAFFLRDLFNSLRIRVSKNMRVTTD